MLQRILVTASTTPHTVADVTRLMVTARVDVENVHSLLLATVSVSTPASDFAQTLTAAATLLLITSTRRARARDTTPFVAQLDSVGLVLVVGTRTGAQVAVFAAAVYVLMMMDVRR